MATRAGSWLAHAAGARWLGAFAVVLAALPPGPAHSAASDWDGHPQGAARLVSAVEATGSASRLDLGLQLRLAPGWHTYWRSPGDAGIPPTVDWGGSENLAAAAIAWPAPVRLPPASGLETIGYEDGVVLPVAVTLARPGAPLRLHAEVDYAACRDICVPLHASLSLALPAGLALPGAEAGLIAAARDRVPGEPAASGLALGPASVVAAADGAVLLVPLASTGAPLRRPDLFVEGASDVSAARPAVTLDPSGRHASLRLPVHGAAAASLAGTPLRLTVVDGARAAEATLTPTPGAPSGPHWLGIAGLALLGGLVLNLMPCVLPVLSLKLLALVGYAGAARRGARLGLLATAAGIVASFLALAAVLVGLKAAGAAIGWGIQFQQPWFLAGMALLTTLFAASLWDWLPLDLPGGVAGAVGGVRGRGRLADAFLLGAFATLLAASCSAPFVGTAVGFALARGPLDIALVFAALGLGMAAPFLAVAAAPGLVAWLPRPGAWMGWLRRGLGVALLGTAAWLLSVLAIEAGAAAAALAGAVLLGLLAALAWRHAAPAAGHARPALGGVAALLGLLAVLAPALGGRAGPVSIPGPAALWRPFDAAAPAALVAEGRIVLVDVSAAWCLTCKVNEAAVLDRQPVAALLRSPAVVALRADWTRADPRVTAFLQAFGRYGVPFDVVYGPAAPSGIALPELLTADSVLDAVRMAGGTGLAQASR